MRKIKNKTQNLRGKLFSLITLILLLFAQMNDAKSNTNAQEIETQNSTTQENNNHPIPSNASKKIHAFFNYSAEVSIKRYNQQLLEVNIGSRSVFASNDGSYLYVGKVIDTEGKIDLSEQVAQRNRLSKLANLDNTNQLAFPATVKELFEVTLFTDIDCGYCRRFHSNMSQYNALGIRINYVMLPRAGKNSDSYNKTAAVLCSANPQKNMTIAMQGNFSATHSSVDTRCRKNLNKQMLLANELGITATPTMLLANGTIIEGVMNPEQLLAQLNKLSVSK